MATQLAAGQLPGSDKRSLTPARGRFYLRVSLACGAIAILGFLPTYWLQLAPRTFAGPALLHIHAALCTAWVLFLISQTWLVSNNRLSSHKEWGIAGVSLATAVFIVGLATAISGLEANLARGLGDAARSFFITPLSAILRFGIFTGAAIALVRKPEWHKRLMIVGTVSLIEAAAARFAFMMAVGRAPGLRPGTAPLPPVMMPVVVACLLQLFIVAGMIHDKRVRGSVHPAWIVGLIGSVAVIALKIPLSTSGAWLSFASWATTIA